LLLRGEEMKDDTITELKKLAEKQTWEELSKTHGNEYFDPNDYAGGNMDDAYAGGLMDGEITLAREILALENNE
jgi:hypothetical protein